MGKQKKKGSPRLPLFSWNHTVKLEIPSESQDCIDPVTALAATESGVPAAAQRYLSGGRHI